MRPKSPDNRDLPPRMIRRIRTMKNGKQWVGYYYNGVDAMGKRMEIPLGTDLDEAKRKWAELDCKPLPRAANLMGAIFDRYEREIIPTKAPRTQRDNLAELKQLRPVFEYAPIDAITPHVIAQYRDKRSAKTRANREIALLSHIFNIAREWGLTEKENPAAGVRRNKEKPRDYYAAQDVWDAVYGKAAPELRDAMDLAYLTGQRPADVLAMKRSAIAGDFLLVGQSKTAKKLRIRLVIDGKKTGLGQFIDGLLERHQPHLTPFLIATENGMRVSSQMLRVRWDDARARAATEAAENGNGDLDQRIRQFQFRDIRPKAASEIDDLSAASRLLGHSSEQLTDTVYRRVGEVVDPTR
ncbi:Phage integrase family protein [Azotobacter beijerinckii]|uniref:Phage integrase family protein n=1 Tax=Azotobacter beijerinckii TaxID=170623 RepID=A0A1H9JRS0_9GAMM|nr:tyrosine-type recombinase/integrase [Azotobacter beijerinckii]SEQ89566.1 Phage integrase family protein [Azotobacter beijerinckii]